jgi:hypothetical protein
MNEFLYKLLFISYFIYLPLLDSCIYAKHKCTSIALTPPPRRVGGKKADLLLTPLQPSGGSPSEAKPLKGAKSTYS